MTSENLRTASSTGSLQLGSRSMGAKFFLVLLLAALMSLPGVFLSSTTEERAQQHHVENPVSAASAPRNVLGIRLADSYRSVQRSLKYITLFLGLVFLTFFLFEVSTGSRVHPAQYALIGVGQIVFYLLLLSLAEHMGFDWAFLLASAATITLFSANAEWIFGSRHHAIRSALAFSLVYLFIYALLRLEDYALLVGSVASFAAVGVTMYLTRRIDWYGTATRQSQTSAAAGAVRESWLG